MRAFIGKCIEKEGFLYYFSKKTDKNAVFTTFFIEKLLTIAKNHATIIVYRNRGKGNVGMLIFILVPFMIAYIKGYRIRSALRIWDLYPFFLSFSRFQSLECYPFQEYAYICIGRTRLLKVRLYVRTLLEN